MNKCNTDKNATIIESTLISGTGSFNVTGAPLQIFKSLLINFTDRSGKYYSFAVDTIQSFGASLPAGNTATAQAITRGGKVGGEQYRSGSTFLLYFSAPGCKSGFARPWQT